MCVASASFWECWRWCDQQYAQLPQHLISHGQYVLWGLLHPLWDLPIYTISNTLSESYVLRQGPGQDRRPTERHIKYSDKVWQSPAKSLSEVLRLVLTIALYRLPVKSLQLLFTHFFCKMHYQIIFFLRFKLLSWQSFCICVFIFCLFCFLFFFVFLYLEER